MKQAPLRDRRLANRGMSSRSRVEMSRQTFRKRPRDRWRAMVGAECRELNRALVRLVRSEFENIAR